MKSEILSQERNVVVVKADFEADEVDKEVGKTVREMSKKARIKGFRPGHIPRKTLELYFGRDGIYKETLERMIQEAMETIITDCDLDIVAKPNGKFVDLKEGKPLDMEFTFEVRPEVTLPDIPSLTAEKIAYKVEDSKVEDALGQILDSLARLEPIDEDRPATLEDIVETEYKSYTLGPDGKPKEMDRDRKSTLTLATLRRDIAEHIVGHAMAERFSFDVRLEDDYPDARMAGKTVRYEMEILQLMKRVVPEATDANIDELSKGKYSTVEEMKSDLRRQLEEDAAERSAGSLRESSVKLVSEASEVDIPDSMINRQYAAMRSDQDGAIRRDLGLTLESYLQNNNLSVDEYEENLRKRAREIVRNTLVLDAIAERDEITFTNEDLNEEIIRTATGMNINPQELADSLSKNSDEFSNLAMRVRTRNTMNHIASLVQVTEVEPPAAGAAEPRADGSDENEGHDAHEHEEEAPESGEGESGSR
ncbi:MAG: trigger factor [Synergistaceae bacterium]|nr:trigger factor [Synergistaceae bacterium]